MIKSLKFSRLQFITLGYRAPNCSSCYCNPKLILLNEQINATNIFSNSGNSRHLLILSSRGELAQLAVGPTLTRDRYSTLARMSLARITNAKVSYETSRSRIILVPTICTRFIFLASHRSLKKMKQLRFDQRSLDFSQSDQAKRPPTIMRAKRNRRLGPEKSRRMRICPAKPFLDRMYHIPRIQLSSRFSCIPFE